MTERPEQEMVRRALVPGAVAFPVALAVGWILGGPGAGASAAIGVAVVIANFGAHGLSLAWASRSSIAMVQGVALGGFVVRLGVIVGMLFILDTFGWFSPLAFALTAVPGTMALLAYEAKLALRGSTAARLEIPADPAAVRAADNLALRESP